MDLRCCPNCGAPLPAAAPGAVESCGFCGVEGRARGATQDDKPATVGDAPYRPADRTLDDLCRRYLESVRAYTKKVGVRDGVPDERLLRAVEDKIDIPDARRDDFRGVVLEFADALAADGKPFGPRSHARLNVALEKVLKDGTGGA